MNKSILIAIGLMLALVLWMASGYLMNNAQSETAAPAAPSSSVNQLMRVQTKQLQAQTIQREVVVQGQLEPRRVLRLLAETASKVEQLPIEKGQRVEEGEVIVRLAMDDRQARLNEARAQLRQRQKDLASIQKLHKRALQAENQLVEAQALVASAQALLANIELDIRHTQIRAPFAAVVNERSVEHGTFVQVGDVVATLVDNSTLLISAQVPQSHIHALQLGQAVTGKIINGTTITGKIIYISRVADEDTRSFRVEVEVPNPEYTLVAGMSLTLHIPLAVTTGHFLSPALLALSDAGELGVKGVDANNRVIFYPIDILRTETQGIWVGGLPNKIQLITLGQGFVAAGQEVVPVVEHDS